MQNIKKYSGTFWFGVLIILIISAIAYLPLVRGLGYLNDDWYLMYDMKVKDAGFFHEIFSIDRPGRAFTMIPLFSLFGFNPLFYSLSAFLFRFLGGVSLYWALRLLWPERRFFTIAAALLFTIYPGFLSQPNAIDYQSHILSLFLGLLSVALTIKSVLTSGQTPRIFLAVGSVLAGWGYLSQMEYFIGLEVFRFACIFVLIWRLQSETFWQKVGKGFTASLPFLLIGGGFLLWRLFFFDAEREATDVGLQVSQVFSSPLTGLWWLNYLIQDFFTVTIVAWGLPVYMMAFSMRLREMMLALGWASLAIAVVVWTFRLQESTSEQNETADSRFVTEFQIRYEPVWLSLVSILGGLLPVILVNRHVTLPDYSRYSLIASVGAVMLLALLMDHISLRSVQISVLSVFVAIAVLTHYGNTERLVNETVATRNFWWQVAWRAPQIKEGTTLIASYPYGSLSEDYFVWGPANFIYYPEKQSTNPVEIRLPAAVLNSNTVLDITTTRGIETPLRRGNYLERDFGNVLVLIQTSANGCVRMINGAAPELSSNDMERLFLVAPFSRLENVQTEGEFKIPPEVVFGAEPERDWCYYYQKADLARQRGDWVQIPELLQEAVKNGYYPDDGLEWMPFLQASAVLGDVDQVRRLAVLVTTNKFMRLQSCELMTDFMKKESLSAEVKTVIGNKICK